MSIRSSKTLLFTFIFVLLLFGCTKISDSEIVSQVTNYLNNYSSEGWLGPVRFSKWFEAKNITVKDKLTKDKEMTVICNVTIRILKKYPGGSGVSGAYSFMFGDVPGAVGQEKTIDLKFFFEKYESGWRIKKIVK